MIRLYLFFIGLKNLFRLRDMPKYQNLYLGKGGGKLRVKNGGGIGIVKNCCYEPRLCDYIYWIDFNGEIAIVPETWLEEV